MSSENSQTKWSQFIPLVTVFFFWGFVAASNEILIPVFKTTFSLNNWQSQLVSLAFYIAYAVGSLIYIGISYLLKKDIVGSLGYKNSLALGLMISASGTLLFYPAANYGSFALMLSGLFIVALGFSLQQTVANPLAIALGPIKTGSQRLTLAGGINNFGTTIGPLVVGYAIFGSVADANTIVNVESVKVPYLILGFVFVLVAIFLKFSSLPNHPPIEVVIVKEDITSAKSSALQYPQLLMGMFAIFLYVGVEVSTVSNLPAYLENNIGVLKKDIAPYVSLYWASLMIGRWSGAVEAFTNKKSLQTIFKFIAPYLAFTVYLAVNTFMGHNIEQFYMYGVVVIVLILADLASKGNPARMLLLFSCLAIISLVTGMATTGIVSVYAFTSVGLFCSTLWPCIFTLAVSGLGKKTTQGSSLLIMMIGGGGVISILQGIIADQTTIKISYIVGVICFAYLAFYAWKVKGILRSQGIDFDKKIVGGH